MKTMIISKESTTLRCHESFLLENHTMKKRGKPSLIGNVGGLPISGKVVLTNKVVVDLLAMVVTSFQEVVMVF
jgi:hypothetical protein